MIRQPVWHIVFLLAPFVWQSAIEGQTPGIGGVKPVKFERENIHATKDELDDVFLASLLQSEKAMITSFTEAFGAEDAKKRVAEKMELAFKSGDKKHLLDEYKRRSMAVAEADKPQVAEPATSEADPQAVEAALTGQWRPLRFVGAGKDLPDAARETMRLTFTGGKYIMTMGGNVETGTYEIDASKYPHWITITVGAGENQGNVRQGSFKLLENDQLLTVFSSNDSNRATRFVSTEQNKSVLAAYQRVE